MQKQKNKRSGTKSNLPLLMSLALIALLISAYFLIPNVEVFVNHAWDVLTNDDEKKIKDWVSGFGWFGPVLLVFTMIAQMFLLIVPSLLLMVVSVLAYGPIWGSAIIFVSIYAASSVGYALGKYFGDTLVTRIIGEKSEKKIEGFLDAYGFWAIIVTRINPFLSNDAISLVGGMLRIGYWKFIGATLVGITPLTIYIAFMGNSLESLKTGLLWGSLVSLVIFGIYIWWDKKLKPSGTD